MAASSRRKPTGRGGWRPGAGRPRKPGSVSHLRREDFAAFAPQHIALRLAAGIPSVKRHYRVVRDVIAETISDEFRVPSHEVLPDRIHLTIEAKNKAAMSHGMQGLSIRLARRLNTALERTGTLFGARYEVRRP